MTPTPQLQRPRPSRRPSASPIPVDSVAARGCLSTTGRWLYLLIMGGFLLLGLLSLLGFAGRWSWLLDMSNHDRAQITLLLAVGLLLAITARDWRFTAALSLLLIYNGLGLVPFYWPADVSRVRQAPTYRALNLNVRQGNFYFDHVSKTLDELQPDFALLLETNPTWVKVLQQQQPDWAFRFELPRDQSQGLTFFSTHKPESCDVETIGPTHAGVIVAKFMIDGQPLTIVGAHLHSPLDSSRWQIGQEQMQDLAEIVARQSGPCLLLGDMNSTTWSPNLAGLLRETGLVDSRLGLGIQPTWPARGTTFSLFSIPIDHSFLSPELILVHRRVGPSVFGSDHLPVVTDFQLPKR